MFGNNPFTSGATQNMVQENKFLIPEEIPAQERTAFHGAAAAAHKAGKKTFNFAGKTHPVTMKPATANAIADQKEGVSNNETDPPFDNARKISTTPTKDQFGNVIKNRAKSLSRAAARNAGGDMGDKPVLGKKKKPGENATMNPKLDSGKSKGSEMEQKESVNVSHIRQALMSVLEGENHSPNKDKAEKPEDALKGAGAKKMKDDNKDDGRYHDLEKQSHDDAAKAGRAGPGNKARPHDSKDGDKNVINPADDVTKKGQAPQVKTESYDNMSGLKTAYASMYQKKDEE